MPRPQRFSPRTLVDRALPQFWRAGVGATSIDDLTRVTEASRHAIYAAYPDKRALMLACVAAYRAEVVAPALEPLEAPGAGRAEIAAYFERHISAAEAQGFPAPGCFLANLTTEAAPHDAEVRAEVEAHVARLRAAFANALQGAAPMRTAAEAEALAAVFATFAQGLWSLSRVATDAAGLRRVVATLLALI